MCSERRVLVVMPAYNEAASVGDMVAKVRAATGGLPVLVVNDESDDDTAREARNAGAVVLDLPCRLGAWLATQAGLRYAVRMGYDAVVTCDADGQHRPEDIGRLLEAFDRGEMDVLIGCCVERGSRLRRIAWALFRALSGISLADLTSGFRVYGARSMKLLASPRASLMDYQDMGVLLLLRACRMRVAECGVDMRPRCGGEKSRIFSSWFKVLEYMLLTMITILVRPGCRKTGRDHADI